MQLISDLDYSSIMVFLNYMDHLCSVLEYLNPFFIHERGKDVYEEGTVGVKQR